MRCPATNIPFRRVNPVEKLYASFPFFLSINATYAKQLLYPLFVAQDPSQRYALRDLGSYSICIPNPLTHETERANLPASGQPSNPASATGRTYVFKACTTNRLDHERSHRYQQPADNGVCSCKNIGRWDIDISTCEECLQQ